MTTSTKPRLTARERVGDRENAAAAIRDWTRFQTLYRWLFEDTGDGRAD